MKDLPVLLPDGSVPEARPSALPDQHLTDVLPQGQPASDALAVVHPDVAADALPAQRAARYAGKLAARAQVFPVLDGSACPALGRALCKLAEVQSAA